MSMPKDPIMLLSYVNTCLRDYCPTLADLCRREDADEAALTEALAQAGYRYDSASNRFVPSGS